MPYSRKVTIELELKDSFARAYEQMLSIEIGQSKEDYLLRLILADGIRSFIEAAYPGIYRRWNLNEHAPTSKG